MQLFVVDRRPDGLKVETFNRRKTINAKVYVNRLFVFFYFLSRFPSSPLFFHFNNVYSFIFQFDVLTSPPFFYLQLFISSRNKFVIFHAYAGLYRISHYTMMKLIIGSGKIKIIFNCN